MKGIFFIDDVSSFAFGNPDVAEAWKHMIFECENDGYKVIAIKLPAERKNELLVAIEKLLIDKLK